MTASPFMGVSRVQCWTVSEGLEQHVKNIGLAITISTNLESMDFLDVTLRWTQSTIDTGLTENLTTAPSMQSQTPHPQC